MEDIRQALNRLLELNYQLGWLTDNCPDKGMKLILENLGFGYDQVHDYLDVHLPHE